MSPTPAPEPPPVPPTDGDVPVGSETVNDHLGPLSTALDWIKQVPYVGELNPIWQILILAGVLILACVLVVLLINGVVRGVKARRERRRAPLREKEREDLLKSLPSGLLNQVSVMAGVRTARATILERVRGDFNKAQRLLPLIHDTNIVKTANDHLTLQWTPQRSAEFCVRYFTPLSIVLDPDEWATLAYDAELPTTPTVTGIGETDEGMYLILRASPTIALSEWNRAIPVLSAALDAPDLKVSPSDASTVTVELRDARFRYNDVSNDDVESAKKAHDADVVTASDAEDDDKPTWETPTWDSDKSVLDTPSDEVSSNTM